MGGAKARTVLTNVSPGGKGIAPAAQLVQQQEGRRGLGSSGEHSGPRLLKQTPTAGGGAGEREPRGEKAGPSSWWRKGRRVAVKLKGLFLSRTWAPQASSPPAPRCT